MHPAPLLASSALNAWLPALASLLVAPAWQGLALIVFTVGLLRLLPEVSSSARAYLWTAVLLLVALLPAFALLPAHTASGHAAVWHADQRLSIALVVLWLTASAFRLLQLTGSALHLYALLRRAQPITPEPWLADLLREGSRPAILCSSACVDRPSVAGFLRPRILLPTHLVATLSEADLAHIVRHEREHLRRFDDWTNLAQQLSLALFPLNPALFWLNRRLALERELACDEGVLRSTRARKAYAACLARVAESTLVRRGLSLAIGILGSPRASRRPELALRVDRILNTPAVPMTRRQTGFASALLGFGLLGGTALLAGSPNLISFVPSTSETLAMNASPTSAAAPAYKLASAVTKPTLVKVTLPQPSPSANARSSSGRHSTCVRKAVLRGRSVTSSAPHMRLTRWSAPGRLPEATGSTRTVPVVLQLVPITFPSSPTWYTAVRWQDGGIFVQI